MFSQPCQCLGPQTQDNKWKMTTIQTLAQAPPAQLSDADNAHGGSACGGKRSVRMLGLCATCAIPKETFQQCFQCHCRLEISLNMQGSARRRASQ